MTGSMPGSMMEPLVSAEWLAGTVGAADLVLLDASYYLPHEEKDARALFAGAHLPGARFLDLDAFADPDTELPHMVPSAGRFARLAGALGITRGSRVVVYDQKGVFSAPRGRWLFQLFGHEAVAVLDGGLPAWRAAGHPVEAGEPAAAVPATFVPDLRVDRLAGIGDVKRIVRQGGGEALILDARAAGRFDGSAPEPRPGLPSGHMPGAANLPFTAVLGPDGLMLPPDALRRAFADAGVDGTRRVVASCGTGITACVLALALERAGLPEAAVFDGSWTEWASRPETPKAP